MYEMKDTHILQLDELNGMECRDEGKRSVEQTYDTETGEPTQTSEAQEMLLNLILSLGGIRKEVWEYLLTPRFHDTQAVASVGRLLCYAAPLEWMELSVEALSRMAGTMYVNEITEAYQADMPFNEVKRIFESSDTVFEMCQRRREYGIGQDKHQKKHPDNVTGSEESKDENSLEKTVVNAVMEALQLHQKKTKKLSDNMTGSEEAEHPDNMTGSKGAEHPDNMTGSEEAEHSDNMTGSEEAEHPDNMTGSEGAEHPDNMTGSEGAEHSDNMTGYENEDGYDLLDHRVLMMDLKKEQEKSEKRISFFQILLRRHMKKEFSKLEKDDQVGKIFEIMVNKKYDKNQILSIRRLMNGGMTNEFIFSLLEKDLPETELTDLCETLLNEENDLSGLSENMKADETGGDEE
jgi:predicted transcriptional regulator